MLVFWLANSYTHKIPPNEYSRPKLKYIDVQRYIKLFEFEHPHSLIFTVFNLKNIQKPSDINTMTSLGFTDFIYKIFLPL